MIRKRKDRTRMLAPILPESYCKPIAGMMVASKQMELQMPQIRPFSFPLAISYIQYPKSAVKRILIKVRKMLIFMLHLFYVFGNEGGVNATIFRISGTCSIGFHDNIPGIHAKVSLFTFF